LVPGDCDVVFLTLQLEGMVVGLWGRDGDRWEAFSRPFARAQELTLPQAPGETPYALKRPISKRHALAELAEALPLELRRKAGSGKRRRLIFCVQAESAAIPWAALPLPDGTPLIRGVPVVVASSLMVWTALRDRPQSAGVDVVHDAFGQLASQDAGALRRALATDIIRYLVVVGHGNTSGWINQAIELDDGSMLSAGELLSARLSGTVWMGSCWSAAPSGTAGTGPLGLGTAALLAGARAFVGSSWPLPRHAAAEITDAALPEILAGREAADALAQAQISYLDAHPDAVPWEWATMTATGP
jgi:hypothetical protein